nr:MAG TPA: hypothetical protein [Caudoviricetes sp.]
MSSMTPLRYSQLLPASIIFTMMRSAEWRHRFSRCLHIRKNRKG